MAPPQNGCSGRACAAARAGDVVRVSRRERTARVRGNWYALFPEGEGARAGWPGGLCEGTAGRGGSGELCERTAGRGGSGELCERTAGRGGSGGLCKRAQRRGGSGELCERAQRGGGPAGLCKRAQGTAARRVAAVPVFPPFRDRSRGGREVGAAPPVAGGCCEAGLHRCGWRGADVTSGGKTYDGEGRRPGGLCKGTAGRGGPAGGCRAGLSAIS